MTLNQLLHKQLSSQQQQEAEADIPARIRPPPTTLQVEHKFTLEASSNQMLTTTHSRGDQRPLLRSTTPHQSDCRCISKFVMVQSSTKMTRQAATGTDLQLPSYKRAGEKEVRAVLFHLTDRQVVPNSYISSWHPNVHLTKYYPQ